MTVSTVVAVLMIVAGAVTVVLSAWSLLRKAPRSRHPHQGPPPAVRRADTPRGRTAQAVTEAARAAIRVAPAADRRA